MNYAQAMDVVVSGGIDNCEILILLVMAFSLSGIGVVQTKNAVNPNYLHLVGYLPPDQRVNDPNFIAVQVCMLA